MIKSILAISLWAGIMFGQDSSSWTRWTVMDKAEVGFRYAGVNTGEVNQSQHQELFRGGLKFDPEGRFSLKAGLGTGSAFAGNWNNAALGTLAGSGRLYWKELFLSAEPIRGLELQYGGMGLEPHGTGLVGLSGAGYVTGQRVVIKRSELWVDRAAFTYGYLGDFNQPDMTKRFHRLARGNYRDLVLEKKAGRATLSTQLTNYGGRSVVSVGGVFRAPGAVVGRLEYYHRSRFVTANGFHAGMEKKIMGKFTAGAGYVSVDRFFGPLNADAFFDGKRWYVSGAMPLRAGFSISSIYNKAVGNSYRPPIRNFVSVGINYDLLALFR